MSRRMFKNLNPYQIHKQLVNDYLLKKPGDTKLLLTRDTSKDKTDHDVLRASHRFLWDEDEPATWEEKLAKKYFDKLFKEYAIADLTFYKDNKIALRWRIDKEVISGKGQFVCGNKFCNEREQLKSWEVNFGYVEHGEKKNTLVKLRLCPACSEKLNFHTKKREIKRMKKKRKRSRSGTGDNESKKKSQKETASTSRENESSTDNFQSESVDTEDIPEQVQSNIWSQNYQADMEKSREEELDGYLEDLLL